MAKKFHRDVWVGIVLLIFCIAVFFTAVQILGQASYLPITLSLLMGLCSVFIILKGLRLTKEQYGDFHYSMTIKSSKYAFLFMFFIFIYFLGFRYITYWIATPIFMLLSMKYLKLKSWKVNIVITVLYTLICYVVFVIILHLPIYKVGILGQLFRYI